MLRSLNLVGFPFDLNYQISTTDYEPHRKYHFWAWSSLSTSFENLSMLNKKSRRRMSLFSRLRTNAVPLLSVIATTLFIHLTTVFCILIPWLWHFQTWGAMVLFVTINTSTILLLLNYYLCIVVDPGLVHPQYKPPPWSSGQLIPLVDNTRNDVNPREDVLTPLECHKCGRYKPPRAHHCRLCNACIIRMDHHCTWIANCVGHANQAHFVRFLFWSCVSCWCCMIVLCMRLEAVLFEGVVKGTKELELSTGELVVAGMNFIMLTPTTTMISMLTYNQAALLLANQTTIESMQREKGSTVSYAYLGRRVDFRENPFDLGCWHENAKQVLGERVWFWLLPDFRQVRRKNWWIEVPIDDDELWRQEGHWFPINKPLQSEFE